MSLAQQTNRAQELSTLLPEAEVDVLLVTDLVNVRYLTGYTGSNGLALVGDETRAFVTDFRYVQQAAEQVDPTFERRKAEHELTDLIEALLPDGRLRLGFEEEHLTVRDHARIRSQLPERVELVAVEGLVERLRAVKDADEVARIQEAAKLADAAFEDLLRDGLAGRTERELAFNLSVAMHRQGAEGPSFEVIVAAGPHGALPHATPRDVEVRAGQLVVIDWGAVFGGYCSDCTRTVYVGGGEPSAHEREVYELVLLAQLAGLEAMVPGASTREADASARAVIDAADYGEHFGHGLGHGVGLDIHEAPRVSPRSDSTLAPGNVVTVEPGVYLPGEFGVRIEDLVVVTDGAPAVLTAVSKELMVVD
ncbi:MAG TPA: Xaa-Pro peptidase family protein [Solirubrobacteraceae bacterium]|nr:Xaa-Pro peptidase family protein [Solirubrobacteraceae bacterium]